MKMAKTTKTIADEPLAKVISHGYYFLLTRVNEPIMGDPCYVCNICGSEHELRMDVLDHIVECHLNDTLPDGIPGK